MNTKGLLGKIIIIIIIVLAIIGFTIYTQLKTEGIQLSSGDLQINFKLNDSASDNQQGSSITGGTIYPLDEKNDSINNTNNNGSTNLSE